MHILSGPVLTNNVYRDLPRFISRVEDLCAMSTLQAIANHATLRSLIVDVIGHLEMLATTAHISRANHFNSWVSVLREAFANDLHDLKRMVAVLISSGDRLLDEVLELSEDEIQSFMEVLQTVRQSHSRFMTPG